MAPSRQGRSPWAISPLIALASILGIFGLNTMIEYGPWWRTTTALLAVTCAAVMLTRALGRSRVLPTALGTVTAILIMIPAFARDGDGERRLLPTPGAFTDLWLTWQDGVDHAVNATAPAEATRPFIALITVAVLVLFLVSEHLAISWRATASAGLLLMIPWLPAVVLQHRIPTVALIAAITAWLVALALTRRGPTPARGPSSGAAITATAATLVALLAVAPTAVGGNGWGTFPRFSGPDSFDTATRLNLDLDLRTSLTAQSESTVLSYFTSGQRPDAFRLYALTDFDGTSWEREDVVVTNRPANAGVLWPLTVDNWTQRDRDRIDIQVESLAERNLPIPTTPRSVNVRGDWYYNEELDEVATDGSGSQGIQYQVITDQSYLNAGNLQDVQPLIDAGDADQVDPRYLALDPAIDVERVGSLTDEVTANATNRHEQAVAIQQYLRGPSRFTYDVTVSPSGSDAVSTFLDDRRGYCVQFATTMVMMARTLDIPARLAVGFLPGRSTAANTFEVVGADAHAWPELYFPERGWVRFEPTPAVQSGNPPEWADPFTDYVPIGQDVLDGADNRDTPEIPAVPDTPAEVPEDPALLEDPAPLVPGWAWIGTAATVVLAAVAWWGWRRRHLSSTTIHHDAEGAWATLRRRLGSELAWPATMTPHEAATHVDEQLRFLGQGFTGTGREALTRLSNAVSDERYAHPQQWSAPEHATLLGWVNAVMDDVARAQEEADATGRLARDGARSAPRRGA